MIKVLEPFDSATKRLSTNSKPSLHLVEPVKSQLSKMMPLTSDSVVIAQLRTHLEGGHG